MNNNSWFKKEMPLQTVIGFGGGATGFGAYSSSDTKTYVDDVFSTYLWKGNASARSISTDLDMTKGGMVWIKDREDVSYSMLFDTERGVTKGLAASETDAESTESQGLTAFNNNGFSIGTGDRYNRNNDKIASWSFRETPGFFDVVTWTGNSSYDQTISHNLKCEPGCIMYKSVSASGSWYVYHRAATKDKFLSLNSTAAASTFSDTLSVTSTQFVAPGELGANTDGETYVAYLFAGGTTDATDKAVSFNGTDQKLTWAATSDFTFGTGAYTVEYWVYYDNVTDNDIIFSQYTNANGGFVIASTTGKVAINQFGIGDVLAYNTAPTAGVWTHYAFVRESTSTNKTYIFVNGELKQTGTDATDWSTTQISALGGNAHPTSTQYTDCKICNFRITKGQALYTVPFNVPHDPLTTTSQRANSSNVKVICCNGDTVTASTVTPGTITAVGSPTQTTDNSIFDDTSSYVFGADKDQGIIKTGKYFGNGSTDGPEIFLGWEPQWIMIRGIGGGDWNIVDCMRGLNNDGNDNRLWANLYSAESTSIDVVDVTSTGFKIKHDGSSFNGECIYIAIRRPDGYVGKLPSAATGVFAMDSWVSDSTPGSEPNMLSDFPVDFVIDTDPNHSSSGWQGDRFVRTRQITALSMKANDTSNEASGTWGYFDYGTGWMNRQGYTGYSDWTSWMWKRGQGMDVVCYDGDGTYGREIKHSLNQVPEMMWVKQRAVNGEEWMVYHKGLDGGNQPETHYIMLHSSAAEVDGNGTWNDTAPTSTHFTIGGWNSVNYGGQPQVAYLFASANDADGNPISKVGSYSGSSSSVTVTTGFQPRFVLIKRASGVGQWTMFDTFRGWTAGNDQMMELSDNAAQSNSFDYGEPTATGFTITTGQSATNNNGDTYLYYAHA